jgi:hypothetical protein
MEAGSSSGPDRNQVYDISKTIVEDLQTTQSVSIVGYSQLIPSTQTLEFQAILNQQVEAQMTYIAVETTKF